MEATKKNYYFLIVLIVAVVFAVYWQALLLPFIQDDWTFFRAFQVDGSLILKSFWQISGHPLFYRPLSNGYLFLMYELFGPNPIAFHAVAFTIHVINSCLVALILNKIIGDPLLGYLAALVYASAIAIHLDPLAWAVGIYDVGGAFFFFLSLWLFLKNKSVVSAIVYFLGCLVKESVIVLPIILLSYFVLTNPIARLKDLILTRWKHTIPFWLAIGIIFTIKWLGLSPLELPATHPYVVDLVGIHIIQNTGLYQAWLFQSLFPFVPSDHYAFFFTCMAVLILLYGILTAFRSRADTSRHRRLLFLFVWLLVGLLPVLFLPNHRYRYYSTYSLPAFLGSVFFLFQSILLSLDVKPKAIVFSLVSICSLAVISSVLLGNRIYREGLYQSTLSDGTNQVIRRAAFVNIVHEGLKQYLPSAPSNSSLVFGNSVDIWAFNKDKGPQFWYNDGTIRVYQRSDLKFEEGRPYIENPTDNQSPANAGSIGENVFLDTSRLFVYEVSDGKLIRIDLPELKSSP